MEQHRALLREHTALDYLEKVGQFGRANLPETTLKGARLLYDVSGWADISGAGSDRLRSAFALIQDVFAAENYLQHADKPRYVHYTNLRLLDRYLLSSASRPLGEKHARARRALAIIMRDWYEFEKKRLALYDNNDLSSDILGYEFNGSQDDTVAHIRERVRSLKLLHELSAVQDLPAQQIIQNQLRNCPSDWEYFADEPDRELSHFLCLPRSKWHDEAMFLRMIHATECCFAGILASFDALPVFALQERWIDATQALRSARFFSEFLIDHWAVFTTMPVPHFFDGFREDTGDASAIQSERFQRLDVLLRGLGDAKREALQLQQEGAKYSRWTPPPHASLPQLVIAAKQAGEAGEEFVEVASMLDRDLYKWRSKHVGIARKYLPGDAVGTGSEGIPYLENNFSAPRLDSTDPGGPAPAPKGSDDASMRIRQTSTMALTHDERPRLAAFRFGDVSSADVKAYVQKTRTTLAKTIRDNQAMIDQVVTGYGTFFGATPYPVREQRRRFVENGRLAKLTAPALLLTLELQTGVLMGLHRLERGKALTFDIATEGESFLGIGGAKIQCGDKEPVLRDHKGIIASVFQGPDKRTAVDFDGREQNEELFLVVIGYPDIPDHAFEKTLENIRTFISTVGSENREEWQS